MDVRFDVLFYFQASVATIKANAGAFFLSNLVQFPYLGMFKLRNVRLGRWAVVARHAHNTAGQFLGFLAV